MPASRLFRGRPWLAVVAARGCALSRGRSHWPMDAGTWARVSKSVRGHDWAMERSASDDPFVARFEVPVTGGTLHVARAGPPANAADCVVLAAHGVTASLMTWRTIARELDERICLLAPDLRGRGRSATLPGPNGLPPHVADLPPVLDYS